MATRRQALFLAFLLTPQISTIIINTSFALKCMGDQGRPSHLRVTQPLGRLACWEWRCSRELVAGRGRESQRGRRPPLQAQTSVAPDPAESRGAPPPPQDPSPLRVPGESQGRGSLVGCCLWGRTESDTTEATKQQQQQQHSVNGTPDGPKGKETCP